MTFNGGSAGSLQWRGDVSEKPPQTFDLLWYVIIVRMFPVCISFPVLLVFKLVHVKEIQKYYFIYVVSLLCAVITNSRRPPSRERCDHFICGVHNDAIQKKLLTADGLTTARALEIAQGIEAADKNARELKGAENPKLHESLNFAGTNKAKPCYRCGRQQVMIWALTL